VFEVPLRLEQEGPRASDAAPVLTHGLASTCDCERPMRVTHQGKREHDAKARTSLHRSEEECF